MESSRAFTSRLASSFLPVVLILLIQSSAIPSTIQDARKKKVFTEEDEKVEQIPGKWRLASGLDMQQAYDYSVPVVVTYINTFYGQGKYAGRVKIIEAKLENRVQKTTRSVQLRWAIVMHEEPNTVLLEGVVLPIEVHIEANSGPLLVDIPPIYFNKIVRPLLKDGEISGHLRLVVGVQEVRFADGSTWQRTQQSALLRASPGGPQFRLQARRFKPIVFFDLSRWRSPLPEPPPAAPCGE